MPKKFQGENTKSAAARARRAEAKAAADAKKQKELEDAYWRDEDKHVMRKEQRKEEKEKRRLEQLERKKETQRLLEEEDSKLKGGKAPGWPPPARSPAPRLRRLSAETISTRKALTQPRKPKATWRCRWRRT